MMVTPNQLAQAKKACEKLTGRGANDEDDTMKVESGDEADRWDPLGDVVPEELEATGQSDAESAEDTVEGGQYPAAGRPAAGGARSKPGQPPKSKHRAKRGRSKALDIDVARFIATESCRTRVLDEIFRNPPHKPCEEVGGCDNCVRKRLQSSSDVPDLHTADRAVKREEVELQIVLEDPEEISQLPHKILAKNRVGAELGAVKNALTKWRRSTFEAERKSQDLEFEDIMTDRALAVIARTRAVDNVAALDRLEPPWPSRERWGQAVVEVIRRQLEELQVTSENKLWTSK
ncbi:hypothetical protein FRC08_007918 [Ceratobasidium sp. 394]|nr:hypothetical protein FRC08_007918 [Ceratobasidium sp. 394]